MKKLFIGICALFLAIGLTGCGGGNTASDEKTLNDIKKSVIANNADLGIAFDGDSDRIGVIASDGQAISGDKLLLIYAEDYLNSISDKASAPAIVSEVKCSQVLFDTINQMGGTAIMCRTGHGYIKSKMKETGALLAGEMSGHVFFKDRYYGYDDAIYAGCRIIEILAKNKKQNPQFKLEDLLKPFSKVFTSKEYRINCPNDKKKAVLEKFQNYVEEHPMMFSDKILNIVTIDGMRIIFDGGFALVRQSNTEPVFTLRFEAKTQTMCEVYIKAMVDKLNELIKD